MTNAFSWLRLAFRTPKIFQRPPASGECQCMCAGSRADKLSAKTLLCWRLKAECRFLALVGAGSTQIRRVPESIFSWLLRHDIDSSVSETGALIFGKLLARSYNCGAAFFKFEVFVLEPRQIILQQRLLELECEHCALCVNEACQQVGRGSGDLAGVAFGDQSLGDGFGASEGCDGHLNFAEHGCPSGGSVRVEELALSAGCGRPTIKPSSEGENADA